MTITLKGGPELLRFLDELPKNLERNVIRGGLRAGAKVIQQPPHTRMFATCNTEGCVQPGKVVPIVAAIFIVLVIRLALVVVCMRMQSGTGSAAGTGNGSGSGSGSASGSAAGTGNGSSTGSGTGNSC